MKRFIGVLGVVTIVACTTTTSVGRPIYKEQFEQVSVGKSTVGDVRKYFGHPMEMLISTSGTVEMTWSWSVAESSATAFVPFAGGGATGTTTKIVARFDKSGLLTEILRGGGTMDISMGTSGGRMEINATPGELQSAPIVIEGGGAKCSKSVPCPDPLVCTMMEGKDYGYCVGGKAKAP